jgi:hypothetical protein
MALHTARYSPTGPPSRGRRLRRQLQRHGGSTRPGSSSARGGRRGRAGAWRTRLVRLGLRGGPPWCAAVASRCGCRVPHVLCPRAETRVWCAEVLADSDGEDADAHGSTGAPPECSHHLPLWEAGPREDCILTTAQVRLCTCASRQIYPSVTAKHLGLCAGRPPACPH